MKKKKLIYICSPYAGDTEANIQIAKLFSQKVTKKGHLPICVHLFLEKVTGLSEWQNRKELLKQAIEYLKICDEIWINSTFGISKGMQQEINKAKELNITEVWI